MGCGATIRRHVPRTDQRGPATSTEADHLMVIGRRVTESLTFLARTSHFETFMNPWLESAARNALRQTKITENLSFPTFRRSFG